MLFGRSGGISWLVVGLGNPGTQYESTRHNMGFLAVDKLAQEENFRFSKLRFKAWTATWGGRRAEGARHEAADVYEPIGRVRGRGGAVL